MGDNNENTPVKPVVVNLSIDVTTVTKSSIKVHKDTKVLKTSKQKILCPEIRLVPDVQTWPLHYSTKDALYTYICRVGSKFTA